MATILRCNAAARRMAAAVEPRMAFSSLASSMAAEPGEAIVCGRGDKRTKKGKRFKGSFGNCRPKKDKIVERIKDKQHSSNGNKAFGDSSYLPLNAYPGK